MLKNIPDMLTNLPEIKKQSEDAGIGIDSANGRYLTGPAETPISGLIACGAVAEISSRSQVLFKGMRLFVAASCAPDFLIHSILVGHQWAGTVNSNPIIAEPFAVKFDDLPEIKWESIDKERVVKIVIEKNAVELMGMPLSLPTMQPGIEMTFRVENIGLKPKRFLAFFWGNACF